MKRISKYLIPPFLRRFDTFLLENYPVVWRTRIHFVLFYSILAAVVLFVAGYCYPVSATNLTVDPIKPINIARESYYFISLAFAIIGILYWAYTQYASKVSKENLKSIFARLGLYAIGLYTILALDTTAFRMGMIVRTVYDFIKKADIKEAEENDFFRFGFVLHEGDTLDQEAYYEEGERILDTLVEKEELILDFRYDRQFFDDFFDRLLTTGAIDSSYRSYRSYLSDMSDMSDMSYRSYRSHRSYLSDLSDIDLIYDYYTYYQEQKRNTFLYDRLEINQTMDSVKTDEYERIFLFSDAPYILEDMIRSVKHARLYFEQGIVFRYWRSLLLHLPLVLTLFSSILFLKYSKALLSVIFVILYIIVSLVLQTPDRIPQNLYLLFPTVMFIFYLIFFKKASLFSFFFHCIVVSVLGILLSVTFLNSPTDISNSPKNLAFFSVSAMGIIAVILRAYVDKLPKGR